MEPVCTVHHSKLHHEKLFFLHGKYALKIIIITIIKIIIIIIIKTIIVIVIIIKIKLIIIIVII